MQIPLGSYPVEFLEAPELGRIPIINDDRLSITREE
jgi:hypothetical protein